MCGDQIIIGNKKYRIHPEYLSFGVDEKGNVIDVVSRKSVEINRENMTIRLKKYMHKRKTLDIVRYVWETYNGPKPNGMTIIHTNGDKTNFSIDNLKLRESKKRKYSSDEERQKSDDECKARWKKREWICPKCGKVTNNNVSGYHKRVCTFTDNPLTEKDKRMKKQNDLEWRNRTFTCKTCGKTYKNNYKSIHTRTCKMKHQ